MIGDRLKQRLHDLGYTQQKAADKIGISQSRLNQYLKNKREPNSQMIKLICQTFQITPSWLYAFDGESETGIAKTNKKALETAILFLKNYEKSHKKSFSVEQQARIIAIVYDIILTESEENANKAIEWVIEAVA